MICATSSNLTIIIVALCLSMLSGCYGDVLLSLHSLVGEWAKAVSPFSLFLTFPSSHTLWESCWFLFFISKGSIDALLAPVFVQHFSLFPGEQRGSSDCLQSEWGLPCSYLQITQKLCGMPWRGTFWTPVVYFGCVPMEHPLLVAQQHEDWALYSFAIPIIRDSWAE